MHFSFISFPAGILCFILFISCSRTFDSPEGSQSLLVSMTFKGPGAKGNYYTGYLPKTDWTIWIKNSQNRHIRTLKINSGVVKIGKYGAHVKHLPEWLACRGDSINDIPDTDSIPARYDAITAASILFDGSLIDTVVSAIWDFKDTNGNLVDEDTYYFCAEAANIQKDSANNAQGYTLSIFSETSIGSVVYPLGLTTNGIPTQHILSLTGGLLYNDRD